MFGGIYAGDQKQHISILNTENAELQTAMSNQRK